MKTQEELQRELNKQTLDVESVILMLDKVNMILSDWTQEYGFIHRPDPRKAIACGSSKAGERDREAEESKKWFYEYNRIYTFIDIVSDYVHDGRKLLKKAVYGEKENKGAA